MERAVTREDVLQDLAYARNLAEEGRHAPLIGGAFLVLFGALLAVAWTAHWAVWRGMFGPNVGGAVGFIWLAFGACAIIGAALVGAAVRRKPGGNAIGNRIDRTVWRATAWAILSVVVGTISAATFRGDHAAPNAIMAAAFGFYGVAMITTGSVSGQNWLGYFGAVAMVVGSVLWAFNDQAWSYLAAAGSALVVLVAPGLIMMRREPKSTV
jgi:drug/metabolite transporter (DMT)-like permease